MEKKECGKSPIRFTMWDKTHIRVGSNPENLVYTTSAAMHIVVTLIT